MRGKRRETKGCVIDGDSENYKMERMILCNLRMTSGKMAPEQQQRKGKNDDEELERKNKGFKHHA